MPHRVAHGYGDGVSRWRRWRAWTKAHPLFFDTCLALVLLVGGLLSLGPGNDGTRGPDGHPIVFEPTAASYVLLVLACLAAIWLSARIYRVGLLMYGKRPSLRELGRWIRQS